MQKPVIIDTHCHYNLEPLLENADKHWQESLDSGVVGAICVGTNLETSRTALKLAKNKETMFASIGIHPGEYTEKIKNLLSGDEYSEEEIEYVLKKDALAFRDLLNKTKAKQNSKLVAIGEIGLDYFWLRNKGLKRKIVIEMQKQAFTFQLEAAFKNNLPVILHVRDQSDRTEENAYFDTFTIVEKLISRYKKESKDFPKIILHCVSGPIEYVKKFLELGAYIGVAGNVTYTNAPEIVKIVKITPKDRLLLETDAPYLAPNDKKREICEPKYIVETGQFLQDSYRINLDIIIQNTLKVFPKLTNIIK